MTANTPTSSVEEGAPVSIDSTVYKHSFYGILNKQGDFWTPLAFEHPTAAERHIREFWAYDRLKLDQCLRDFKIVPVKIVLTALPEIPHDPS